MNTKMTLEQAINTIKNTTVKFNSHSVCHFVNGFEDTISGFIILWNGEDRAMELSFKSPRPYAEQVLKDIEETIEASYNL